MNKPRTINKLWAASLNSWRGLRYAAATERAVRQELVILAVAIPAAFFIGTTLWVRTALIASVLLLLAVEFLNTAIEKLCDHVNPDHHPVIGRVKDFGSAAVLCTILIVCLIWVTALLERLAAFPA